MDQVHGTQEGGFSERGKEAADPKVVAYRQIAEGTLRLYSQSDPDRTIQAAIDFLKHFLACPGVVLLQAEGVDHRHPFGGAAAEAIPQAQIAASAQKAIEAGHPVVDGQGLSRGVAIPLAAGARNVGALYVTVSELERRYGPSAYLEILVLVGKHLGTAFDIAHHVRDLGTVSASSDEADLLSNNLSLSESKRAYEKKLIRVRLREARGNIAAAARSLDMDRGQLSRLLKKHGIDKSQYRGAAAMASKA